MKIPISALICFALAILMLVVPIVLRWNQGTHLLGSGVVLCTLFGLMFVVRDRQKRNDS